VTGRRKIILGLPAAAMLSTLRCALADGPASLTLVAGGPDGQAMSRWGDACALAMGPCFAGGASLTTQPIGGLDGVTAANYLDALVVADGKTAAMLPGAALTAWLTGDERVHFDPTRWMPVMAGVNSGVLVVRAPTGNAPTLADLRAMPPLRLAADQPESNDLAALLALERLGLKIAPVFGLRNADSKIQAFVAGDADAVFLSGEGVPEDIAPLAANGGVPTFCLGMMAADGSLQPDPLFPGLPDAIMFGNGLTSPLDLVYRAAAAAARLDFIMVLPKLTAPGPVAFWRQAAAAASGAQALDAAASASTVYLQPAPVLQAEMSSLNNLLPADQSGLQAFLIQRFGWQPG